MAKIIKVDTENTSEKAIILSKTTNEGLNESRSRIDTIRETISNYKNLPIEPWQHEIINMLGLVNEGFRVRACPYPAEAKDTTTDLLNIRYEELGLIVIGAFTKYDLLLLREYGKSIGKLLLEPRLPNIFWHLLIDEIITYANPYGIFGQSAIRAKIAANGFTNTDVFERTRLPGYRKLQFLKICLESSQIKARLNELLSLNPNYEIFPTHLLSSLTREEKRNYHLIMESKRTKASAQVIDASKISKEPPREYIQTTNGIVKFPNFEEFTRITERLFEEHFTTHLNGASNEQQ